MGDRVSRRGIVYVVQEYSATPADPAYAGNWEHGDIWLSDGWDTFEEAVAWGRQRAPVVLIRIGRGPDERYLSAGAQDVATYAGDPIEKWTGGGHPVTRLSGYGGVVHLEESTFEDVHLGELRATWAAQSPSWPLVVPSEFLEQRTFDLVDDAVAWARSRAEIVVVRESGTDAEWLNAGDKLPGGHDLRMWQRITLRPASPYYPEEPSERG